MDTTHINMTNLFRQLGLPADEDAIAAFIGANQLPEQIALFDAPFWSEGQLQFLREAILADDDWAIVIDALNEALHQQAVRARTGL